MFLFLRVRVCVFSSGADVNVHGLIDHNVPLFYAATVGKLEYVIDKPVSKGFRA